MTNSLRLMISLGILSSLIRPGHGEWNTQSTGMGTQTWSRPPLSAPLNYFPAQSIAPASQSWPAPHQVAVYQAGPYQTAPYSSASYPAPTEPNVAMGPANFSPTGPLEIGPVVSEAWGNFRSPANGMGVQLGVLGLVRERPDGQILAYDENIQPILNASELQGSMQFGVNALVDFYNIHRALGGTDLQFGYFGINSLDAVQTIAAGEVISVFFNAIPLEPPAESIFLYSSNLYSGEANLRFMSRARIRPIVGLRFLKFEDQFDIYDYATGIQLGGFSKTNNHLFGGQFGAEADVWRFGQTRWYASGKFATMHNQVDGSARAADGTGNEVEKYYGDQHFATLVDAGTGLDIGLAGPLSLRVGYRALLASGVATGLDQSRSIHLLSAGETVVFGSQQWHGIDLAAMLSF